MYPIFAPTVRRQITELHIKLISDSEPKFLYYVCKYIIHHVRTDIYLSPNSDTTKLLLRLAQTERTVVFHLLYSEWVSTDKLRCKYYDLFKYLTDFQSL